MVAKVSPISSSQNAGKYFYFTENDFECSKGWQDNRATEELGLKELNRKNFEKILDGKLHKDIALGRTTKEGLKHHPGQELILSPPKSVSIMALVAKDERVIEAHENAVSSTLDYVTRYMIYTRIQDKGRQFIEKTDNAPIAKFTHMTSRSAKSADEKEVSIPDPQLHTHSIIANATLCKDGKWRSVVFDSLYDNQMNLGEIYRMELARGIEKLGYGVELKRDKADRWTFEIQGVSAKDIQEFSQRRQGIVDKAEEMGVSDAESLAYIAKTTREAKTHHSMEELKADWEQRGDLEHILQIYAESEGVLEKSPVSQPELLKASLKSAIESLSEREATFKAEDLHSHMIDMTKNNYSISEIEATISQRVTEGKLLRSKDKENYSYTTSKNLAQEKQTVKLMRDGQDRLKALCGKREVQKFLSGTTLNQGQKDAVKLILNTEDRVVGIQGAAGTAKTTMISAAMAMAGSQGFQFIGLAPTKEAAKVLNHSAHIESQTLHLFLARYDGVLKGRGTAEGRTKMQNDFKNKVVILDEASLASTGNIKKLLTLSESLKFRCVLVGDIRQLGAVESGKPFYVLQGHGMKTAILYDIMRQQNEDLLKSVYSAANAIDQDKVDARSAIFASLKSMGLGNIIDLAKQEKRSSNQDRFSNNNNNATPNTKVLPEDLVAGAYAAWLKERNSSSEDTTILVVAPSNSLRRALNNKIRAHYIHGSETERAILESKNLTHSQSKNVAKYNQGDVIVFNKANNNLSIEKGSYYKVIATDKKDDSLVLANMIHLNINNQSKSKEQNQTINWNPNKALSKQEKGLIAVYQTRNLPLAVGEKIRWTKNSKAHGFIVNGGTATIRKIGASSIKIEVQSASHKEANKIITLEKTDPILQHLDYAYCSTIYSSQGKTVDTVVGIARSMESVLALTTQRSFYVTLSRARHKAILITDSYNGLIRRLSEVTGAKSSAIEHQTTESRVQDADIANLKEEGRSVFIERSNPDNAFNSSMSVKQNYTNKENKEDLESFTSNPQKIRDAAVHLFGAPNTNLSKEHNLRFGRKGSIAVNTQSGQWYDFADGRGGSIYSLAKRDNLLDKESDASNIQGKSQSAQVIESHNIESNSLKSSKSKKTLQHVKKIIKESVALNEYITPASSYVVNHRKINLKNVSLSDDIRFVPKAWSSETQQDHPALASIARDAYGQATASQVVYLDKETYNKDKSLEVQKRSRGTLKGSFVELTKNKDANTIFIAEGVETGISIASVQPKARVICSLGISNIRNINLSTTVKDTNLKNKTIIICADNDGKDSKTNIVIEQAASTLKDQGFKAVSIIRPDFKGHDFNDVLQEGGEGEVQKYIAPLLRNHPDYKKQLNALEEKLALQDRSLKLLNDSIKSLPVFKDHALAITKWKELVSNKGVASAKEIVRRDPALLGDLKGLNLFIFQTKGRVDAMLQTGNLIAKLADHSIEINTRDKLKEQEEKLILQLKNKHLADISNFKTKGLDHKELNFKLTRVVQHSLAAIDKNLDYEAVKSVTQKVTEKIILYKQRYRAEPDADLKITYFLGARHEQEQKGFLEKELNKLIPGNTLKDRVLKAEKLDRLSSIDLRLTQEATNNRDKLFYKPVAFKDVLDEFKEGNGKISILTYNHMQQGMNKIKANFVATEIVKYEEKIGAPMPIKQQENLQKVGDYVSNNYKELISYGFSKDEARIAYLEGSKLAMNYKPTERDLAISRGEIQLTQADIKRTIERHGFCQPEKSMAINKDQIQAEEPQKTKTISHEKGGIEIEM